MKITLLKYTLSLLLLLSSGYGLRAQANNECMTTVRTFYKKINKVDFPGKGKVYFYEYDITTIMRDTGSYPEMSGNVKLYYSASQVHSMGKDFEIYQDDENYFLIVHSQKVVIWSTPPRIENKKEVVGEVTKFKDQVFDICEVVECRSAKNKQGKNRNLLIIKPQKEFENEVEFSRVSFLFDPVSGNVEKTTMKFVPQYEIKEYVIDVKKIDLNCTMYKMDKPVKDIVLGKNNRLLKKYAGYQLIDERETAEVELE